MWLSHDESRATNEYGGTGIEAVAYSVRVKGSASGPVGFLAAPIDLIVHVLVEAL